MTNRLPRGFQWLGAGALLAIIVIAVVALPSGDSESGGTRRTAGGPAPQATVVPLDADGPAFANLSALQTSSTLVAKGTPLSAAYGQLEGGVPQTIYRTKISDVPQGDVALIGSTISVVTLGGKAGNTVYEADGLRPLKIGAEHIFFLAHSGGQRYYPLGGTALAPIDAKGRFTLGMNVTGASPITAPVSTIACKGKAPKGTIAARAVTRKAKARIVATTKRRVGSSAKSTYRVKLVKGCVVVASGTAHGKRLTLNVRALAGTAKRKRYPRLRGKFVLRTNGGTRAVAPTHLRLR